MEGEVWGILCSGRHGLGGNVSRATVGCPAGMDLGSWYSHWFEGKGGTGSGQKLGVGQRRRGIIWPCVQVWAVDGESNRDMRWATSRKDNGSKQVKAKASGWWTYVSQGKLLLTIPS